MGQLICALALGANTRNPAVDSLQQESEFLHPAMFQRSSRTLMFSSKVGADSAIREPIRR